MSIIRLILIAAAAVLGTVPALAQQETGTRLGGRPSQDPDYGSRSFRARVWLQGYADCVVGRDFKRVSDMLDADIASQIAPFKLTQRGFDECLSGGGSADELRISDTLLLGALYSSRVTRTVQSLPASTLPVSQLTFPPASQQNPDVQARIALVRFGECVMRKQPEAALAYVAAEAGTTHETNALSELAPFLGTCIDQGMTIKVSRSMLESALSEAIYRTLKIQEAAE